MMSTPCVPRSLPPPRLETELRPEREIGATLRSTALRTRSSLLLRLGSESLPSRVPPALSPLPAALLVRPAFPRAPTSPFVQVASVPGVTLSASNSSSAIADARVSADSATTPPIYLGCAASRAACLRAMTVAGSTEAQSPLPPRAMARLVRCRAVRGSGVPTASRPCVRSGSARLIKCLIKCPRNRLKRDPARL